VTPAYTDSAILDGIFAVSSEGSRLIGGSLGAFGGTNEDTLGDQGNVAGAAYEFTRMPGQGWLTVPVGPTYSEFTGNGMFDASTDLSATLWELGRINPGFPPKEAHCPLPGAMEEAQLPHVTDLYLERPIGKFARIGPPTPNLCVANAPPGQGVEYDYLGASDDLSHVLFSTAPGYHWPFDETIATGGALYEYTGVERPGELEVEQSGEPKRKPVLVGVEGGPGSRTLISHCGTRLGSSSAEERVKGSLYNAISASGRRIFFTAVGTEEALAPCDEGPHWGELYAREEAPLVEGEVPAAIMRTVPISQPTSEDCRQCIEGSEPDAPAVFQGASLDGSKVFFTTAEELFSGVKGVNLYEYNFDAPSGERVKLLSGETVAPAEVQGVARISEDGSHIYFVAKGVLTTVPNDWGEQAGEGKNNLYVCDEGRVSFIARLSTGDSEDWAQADNRPVLASENGDLLVFTSMADLTNEGLNGRPQVFQYDAVTGTLVRASIGENGYDDDGREPNAGATLSHGLSLAYSYVEDDSPTMATGIEAPSDGAVFFSSPDALTPGAMPDQNIEVYVGGNLEAVPVPNIYEYRAGNVYLLSDGHDLSDIDGGPGVYLAGWDPSGQDVFFFTADSLIPSDSNTQQDLYDARVEGGFLAPPSPTGCGEICQGALAGTLSLAPLGGSATQTAEPEAPQPSVSPSTTGASRPAPKPPVRNTKGAKTAKRKFAKKSRRVKKSGEVFQRGGHRGRAR
jgi:hypothetical protein